MEIAVSVGLVIVGGIIGFFVARYWYGKSPSQATIKQAENELKSLLSQQSEHHIFQSKQVLGNIEKQCAELTEQLNAYERLLAPEESQENQTVPFFGEHATTYLRNQLDKRTDKSKPTQTDTQPRDFAAAGSGLFAGQNDGVIDNDNGTKSES